MADEHGGSSQGDIAIPEVFDLFFLDVC